MNVTKKVTKHEGKIPFEISITDDPYYNPVNMKILRQSMQEATEGEFVTKTTDELRAME
jgi:DNA-damage-inducible protein J